MKLSDKTSVSPIDLAKKSLSEFSPEEQQALAQVTDGKTAELLADRAEKAYEHGRLMREAADKLPKTPHQKKPKQEDVIFTFGTMTITEKELMENFKSGGHGLTNIDDIRCMFFYDYVQKDADDTVLAYYSSNLKNQLEAPYLSSLISAKAE